MPVSGVAAAPEQQSVSKEPVMCLDPRPDSLSRTSSRSFRRIATRSLTSQRVMDANGFRHAAVAGPSAAAIDVLAGDDDLVARGWVLITRDA